MKVKQIMAKAKKALAQSPLVFFLGALTVIEGAISATLIFSDIPSDLKYAGFRWACVLFIVVCLLVWLLVWSRPTHLIFSEEAHLKRPVGDSKSGTRSPKKTTPTEPAAQ
ncbi:MAG: hypothetical protein JSV08_09445 [Acidobacteriota bacterium]|nr:MAG: hypothetical protein JSV08_09445 [Acidobacteriota bacterium]